MEELTVVYRVMFSNLYQHLLALTNPGLLTQQKRLSDTKNAVYLTILS